MKHRLWAFVVAFLCYSSIVFAERQDILLNNQWKFRFSHQVQKGTEVRVDLPHTWNAQDALSGKIDYKRGIGNYEKKLFVQSQWKGKRLFLRFEGVNSIANVFINRKHIGEHRGGYGAFVFEITDRVEYGKDNSILVRVNNGEQLDIMPLVGDFNFYGGIYRDVHLLVTDEICISPLDYASPGVRLIQDSVSHEYACVRALIDLSNGSDKLRELELNIILSNAGKVVKEKNEKVTLYPDSVSQKEMRIELNNPHLWNGRQDPFLYQVEVSLLHNGEILDQVIQPLGLRFYRIDPDEGFFLNGEHLPLRGVCRHQDRSEIGNALHPEHHEEDAALMLEMGVNAVRLAHYPLRDTAYKSLLDRAKINGTALPKLSREKLSEVLNSCLALHNKSGALLLIRDEKVAAAHSGDSRDYSILEIDQLLEGLRDKMDARFPDNRFLGGYSDHAITSASWSLPMQKEDLLGAYEKMLESMGKKATASRLTPGIRFSTSDTGMASAKVAALLVGLEHPIHIGSIVAVEHRRQSKIPDFIESLDQLFAQYGDSIARLTNLLTVQLEHPVNAMTATCKKLSLPKKAALESIAMFEAAIGNGPATAHDVFMAMQEIPFIMKTSGVPESKLLTVQETMARALTLRWSDYDYAKQVSY